MENYTCWEYKTLKFSAIHGFFGGKVDDVTMNLQLNELGEQGWELVNTIVTAMGYGTSRDVIAIFKKQKGW